MRCTGCFLFTVARRCLSCHPPSVCKVRDGNRLSAHCDGLFREDADAHPGSRVIDIDRARPSIADTLCEFAEDEVVHTAVSSFDFALQEVFPDRMVILLFVFFCISPVFVPEEFLFHGIQSVQEDGIGLFLIHAFVPQTVKSRL